MDIVSPMARGNGACLVHAMLSTRIPGYRLIDYSPKRTYMPLSLCALGRGCKHDVLHVTPDYAPFHAGLARANVITFHNYVLDPAMRPHASVAQRLHYRSDLRLFTRAAIGMADRVTCVSESTRALVVEDLGYHGPVTVIPNGIDTRAFTPGERQDRSGFTVLYSGNTSRRKGFHLLAELAALLPPSIRVVYTGGLNSSRTESRDPGRLTSLGRVEHANMPGVYRGADLLLVTSFREGHSLAVLEAMACGLPVVAFDIPSIREQITHAEGGLLVPFGDLSALAGAVVELCEDAAMRDEMGRRNRERVVAGFTVERMAQDYRDLFRSVS